MSLLIILIIAISLSMDAFSLALAYGTLKLEKKQIKQLSIIVGIFHFFMPLLGMIIGSTIFHILPVRPSLIVFIILCFIGIQMIIESFKENKCVELMDIAQLLLFGFAVSVDSFSVGIGFKAINENYILCACLFSISSYLFTYMGLLLGKKISLLIGKTSTIIGGIILIVIGLIYLVH